MRSAPILLLAGVLLVSLALRRARKVCLRGTRTEDPARLKHQRIGVVRSAALSTRPLPMALGIAYRSWVDAAVPARDESLFHSFLYTHTLGVPAPSSLKASETASVLVCLAEAGLLRNEGRATTTEDAIVAWLEQSLVIFEARVALHEAAAKGALAQLSCLLDECDCDIDAMLPATFWETALQAATRNGHTRCMACLLDLRADCNASNGDGWTALHVAAKCERSSDAVALLLARGADLHATTKSKLTALHTAACQGRLEAATRLVAMGIDVDATDEEGLTALEKVRRRRDSSQACPCSTRRLPDRKSVV